MSLEVICEFAKEDDLWRSFIEKHDSFEEVDLACIARGLKNDAPIFNILNDSGYLESPVLNDEWLSSARGLILDKEDMITFVNQGFLPSDNVMLASIFKGRCLLDALICVGYLHSEHFNKDWVASALKGHHLYRALDMAGYFESADFDERWTATKLHGFDLINAIVLSKYFLGTPTQELDINFDIEWLKAEVGEDYAGAYIKGLSELHGWREMRLGIEYCKRLVADGRDFISFLEVVPFQFDAYTCPDHCFTNYYSTFRDLLRNTPSLPLHAMSYVGYDVSRAIRERGNMQGVVYIFDDDCPVCYDKYNNMMNSEVRFPCRHSVCLKCMKRMDNLAIRECPLCRAVVTKFSVI